MTRRQDSSDIRLRPHATHPPTVTCGPVLLAIVTWVLVVVSPLPLSAQTPPRSKTASAKSLKCTFAVLATGTWIDEKAQAEVKAAKLAVEFHAIDTDDGTAETKGAFGPPHIVVRLSGGNLHFLQVASEGPVYVTTVFDQPTPAGRLKAVHTRHEYTRVSLPGFTSRPEQYYGECEVLLSD
jgi:hypothetical protein